MVSDTVTPETKSRYERPVRNWKQMEDENERLRGQVEYQRRVLEQIAEQCRYYGYAGAKDGLIIGRIEAIVASTLGQPMPLGYAADGSDTRAVRPTPDNQKR